MVDTQEMLTTCIRAMENEEGTEWEFNFIRSIKGKVAAGTIEDLTAKQVECLEKIYHKVTA